MVALSERDSLTQDQVNALANLQMELSMKFEVSDGPRRLATQIFNHFVKMITAALDSRKATDEKAKREFLSVGLSERGEALKKTNLIIKKLDDVLDYGETRLQALQVADHLLGISLKSIIEHNLVELITLMAKVRDQLIRGFLVKDETIAAFRELSNQIFTRFTNTSALINAVGKELSEIKKAV